MCRIPTLTSSTRRRACLGVGGVGVNPGHLLAERADPGQVGEHPGHVGSTHPHGACGRSCGSIVHPRLPTIRQATKPGGHGIGACSSSGGSSARALAAASQLAENRARMSARLGMSAGDDRAASCSRSHRLFDHDTERARRDDPLRVGVGLRAGGVLGWSQPGSPSAPILTVIMTLEKQKSRPTGRLFSEFIGLRLFAAPGQEAGVPVA